MLPMLVPLAGLGMVGLYRWFSPAGWQKRILAVAILAAAFGITQIPMLPQAYRARAIARGYNNMGKAEGERGNLTAAEAHFRKAIDLAGWDPKSHARVNLGRVLELKGDLPGAREMYLEAARIGRENRYPRLHLARLAEQSGELAEAVRWWKDVAALMADPRPAKLQINRLENMLGEEK
jgi:tetratricopeptide (TPR) repeat protein